MFLLAGLGWKRRQCRLRKSFRLKILRVLTADLTAGRQGTVLYLRLLLRKESHAPLTWPLVWDETTLPTILSNHKLEDIFNADEFGLFYQALPNKTLHLKCDKCVGGKHSKIRLTVMAVANSMGDKSLLFVIGKSARSRCFIGVKNIPCRYWSQKKSWMDGGRFEEWIRERTRRFVGEGRRVALIVDNCLAHRSPTRWRSYSYPFSVPTP